MRSVPTKDCHPKQISPRHRRVVVVDLQIARLKYRIALEVYEAVAAKNAKPETTDAHSTGRRSLEEEQAFDKLEDARRELRVAVVATSPWRLARTLN